MIPITEYAMVYDGRRFRGEARLAGNIYGMPFLEFIDVKPAKFRVYPREAHVAEKLHAYTLPRPRENSRINSRLLAYLWAPRAPAGANQEESPTISLTIRAAA